MENKNADFTMISHQKKDWNYGGGIVIDGFQFGNSTTGGSYTVEALPGYEITKVEFVTKGGTGTDTESPFTLYGSNWGSGYADAKASLNSDYSNPFATGINSIKVTSIRVYGHGSSTHTHGSWDYTASGATLTAECKADGDCDLTDSKVSLTLTATSPNYSGSEATITCTDTGDQWASIFGSLPPVKYSGGSIDGSTTTPPTAAGTYTASISAGEPAVTASVNFTIVDHNFNLATTTMTGMTFDAESVGADIAPLCTKIGYTPAEGDVVVIGAKTTYFRVAIYTGGSWLSSYTSEYNWSLAQIKEAISNGKTVHVIGTVQEPHTHTDHYGVTTTTTANDTLTWYCGAGCPSGAVDAAHAVKLTLSATSPNYSGIENLEAFNTATGKTIAETDVKFYEVTTEGATSDGTPCEGTPSEDGYYYAELKVEDATAIKAFTIGTPGGSGEGGEEGGGITPTTPTCTCSDESHVIHAYIYKVENDTVYYYLYVNGTYDKQCDSLVSDWLTNASSTDIGWYYEEGAEMKTCNGNTPVHEHDYTDVEWSKNTTKHWHECVDADCDDKEGSKKDVADHDYGEWDYETDTKICETCGASVTCTHTSGITDNICDYCGKDLTHAPEPTPEPEPAPVEPPKPVVPVFSVDNAANVSIETKNINMDNDYIYMNDFMQWSSNVTDISGNNVKTILKPEEAEKFINSIAFLDRGIAYTSPTHMIYKTSTWISFTKKTIQEMEESGYGFTIIFNYDHKKYQVEIPADAKLSELTENADYVGFLYLMKLFGGKVIE